MPMKSYYNTNKTKMKTSIKNCIHPLSSRTRKYNIDENTNYYVQSIEEQTLIQQHFLTINKLAFGINEGKNPMTEYFLIMYLGI